jgi:hypothetical protein
MIQGLTSQEAAAVLQVEPAAASQRYGRALLGCGACLSATA